ncbi:ABC transporter permease [Oceanirhabdus sp. W0125-5]|uniref:ABC transporter permease n=1 Tax=Oceanirhabdus sp. W0125-5 TaxID=2999116 RepID=UPI0022F2D8E1|nr:FtsX-like permease family protein [Oceanirhabdus sp. W0125-5]WBW96744.1 FtsX-like permease family protein [Oceanirhabdus sp. W0125-5]
MNFKSIMLKEIRNNISKYGVYLLSCTFSMAVFLIFATLIFNKDFSDKLSNQMESVIVIATVITVLFSVILVSYTHFQFYKYRTKYFGVLLSNGFLLEDISKIIIFENIAIYFFSLIFSFVTGGLFSRLFFLISVKTLDLENIHWDLNYKSFLCTSLVFIPIILFATVITVIKTKRMNVIQLMKNERKFELQKSGNLFCGVIGIGMIILSLIAVYVITWKTEYNKYLTIGIIINVILCLIGLYFFVSNFIKIYYSRSKKNEVEYYKNILNISEFGRGYRKNKKVLFILSILCIATVLFSSITYTLYTEGENVVEKEQVFDVCIPKIEGFDLIRDLDLEELTKSQKTDIISKEIIECVYLYAPDMLTESWRNKKWVGVFSVEEFNKVFKADYKVDSGEAKQIIFESLLNRSQKYFNEKIYLKNEYEQYSFTSLKKEYFKVFDRYSLPQGILILLNDNDYKKIKQEALDIEKGIFYLVDYENWHDTGDIYRQIVDEMYLNSQKIRDQNGELYNTIINRYGYHPFNMRNKYYSYKHWMKISSFSIFVMNFVSMMFLVTILFMIYYKTLEDKDEDKMRIEKLSGIGITENQIRKYLNNKLKFIMLVPTTIGSIIGLAWCYVLNFNKTLEMELSQIVVLRNSFGFTGVFIFLMIGYYLLLKRRYYEGVK